MTNTNCLEGIACPHCGQDEMFHILCTTYARVDDRGAETYGNLEWDDDSRATCQDCHFTGPLKEFFLPEPDVSEPGNNAEAP